MKPVPRHEALFRRLIPLLLRKSWVGQIGDPLRFSAAQHTGRHIRYDGMIRVLWGIAISFVLFALFLLMQGIRDWAIICLLGAFYPVMFAAAFSMDRYRPLRWLLFRDGLFLRDAEDRYRFIRWQNVQRIVTRPGRTRSRITLLTDEGPEILEGDPLNLLPSVNKMLELLPESMDATPLIRLRKELWRRLLHANLFVLRNAWHAFGMMLSIPVFVLLMLLFPPGDIGLTVFAAIQGTALFVVVTSYFSFAFWRDCRDRHYLTGLLDELEHKDFSAELTADRSPHHDFGEPPRTVSGRVRRIALFVGEAGSFLRLFPWLFAFVGMVLAVVLFTIAPAEIRYAFLPFQWSPAGEGRVVAIADSGTEKAPNGNQAPSGRDVLIIERRLPDGQTFRCKNPAWTSHGVFQVGQKVRLLEYPGDATCFRIDDPVFRKEILGNIVGIACCVTFPSLILILFFCLASAERRKVLHLMQTARVERFRIRHRVVKGPSILAPLGDWNGAITMPCRNVLPGESVSVFLDESKPESSFAAESFAATLHFDPSTGVIDCDPNNRFVDWFAGLGVLALAHGLVLLRILLVY